MSDQRALQVTFEQTREYREEMMRLIAASEIWRNEIQPAITEYNHLTETGCFDPAGRVSVLGVLAGWIWHKGYQAGQSSASIQPLVFKEVQ